MYIYICNVPLISNKFENSTSDFLFYDANKIELTNQLRCNELSKSTYMIGIQCNLYIRDILHTCNVSRMYKSREMHVLFII